MSSGHAGRFAGDVCLVTGGGRGIGRAVALALAAEGAAVGVASRTLSQCEDVASLIGDRALPLELDASESVSCERAVEMLAKTFGRLTMLVNAAGISPVRQRAEVHDVQAFRDVVDTNLVGAYVTARAAARQLLDGGGAVVNVASVYARLGSPRLAAYGASKAGVVQLTRTLAREWGDRGVRVNSVCPGYVETAMTAELLAVERIRSEIVGQTVLGRIATLDEVVAPILFLASAEASYITGATLGVDGGMTT